jgi:hypothetical protein
MHCKNTNNQLEAIFKVFFFIKSGVKMFLFFAGLNFAVNNNMKRSQSESFCINHFLLDSS